MPMKIKSGMNVVGLSVLGLNYYENADEEVYLVEVFLERFIEKYSFTKTTQENLPPRKILLALVLFVVVCKG